MKLFREREDDTPEDEEAQTLPWASTLPAVRTSRRHFFVWIRGSISLPPLRRSNSH